MKHLTAYLLPIFLFGISGASAQFVSVPTKINTPYGTSTIQTQMYMPMKYHQGSSIINLKHTYTIVLLNDSTIEAKTKIDINSTVNSLSWGNGDNKTIIRPSDTKEIYRIGRNGKKITGIPMDSCCWAFLVDTGKIRTYSITSEIDAPMITYIQKGGSGEIVFLTAENMWPMVADHEKALALVKKDKLLKAIKEYNKGN